MTCTAQGCALLGTTRPGFVERSSLGLASGLSTLHCVSWGYIDASIRVLNLGDAEGCSGASKVCAPCSRVRACTLRATAMSMPVPVQIVGTFEGLHRGAVSCGCVAGNGSIVVLGGLDDCLITVWTVQRKSRFPGTVTATFRRTGISQNSQ